MRVTPPLRRYRRNNPIGTRDSTGLDGEPPTFDRNDPQNYANFNDYRAGAASPYSTEYLQKRWDETHPSGGQADTPAQAAPPPPSEQPQTSDADAGAPSAASDAGAEEEYGSIGWVYLAYFLTQGFTGVLDVAHAEANTRPDAGVYETELPPGGLDWSGGAEGGLLSDPAMRTMAGMTMDVLVGEAIGEALSHVPVPRFARGLRGVGASPKGAGPWVEHPSVTELREGTVLEQCANGACLSASGEIVSGGATTEKELLGRIGLNSDEKSLAEELSQVPGLGEWQGGRFPDEATAVSLAKRGPAVATVQAPRLQAHAVVIEPLPDGRFLVKDPGFGGSYVVGEDWVREFVVGGVWRK
jgi:hypothetical protein